MFSINTSAMISEHLLGVNVRNVSTLCDNKCQCFINSFVARGSVVTLLYEEKAFKNACRRGQV